MSVSVLYIAGTQSTPEVRGDWEKGVLCLRGDSYPENSYELFSPVIDWVEDFLKASNRCLTLDLWLIYLNTSSIKVMMDVFDLMEEQHQAGRPVRVNWYYDERNERVAELASEFKEDCSFEFNIKSYGV